MAVFKCKMCGGALEINGEGGVAVCEYCGSVQTLPKRNDEVVANLFNRANNLRIKCEFDKAAQVYEKILNEDNSDPEAHWGLVLCKYGIEYVEDPKTYKRIPTCHRTQYESVLSDVDYLSALSNSDAQAKDVYKAQAEEISELQKNILAIVKNEKPFDVFICYKETDENGKRSVDSTIANDIYYQLTQEGLKVFYAAITLEDKLGQEYEPYIFAALNSAKVMLVVGTKPEYFDSIWVRNEWSRYLKLMKNDRSRLLIPCYRDMDAYDLPEEFAHLQAQDMGKIGFVNDIVRGIKKVVEQPKNKEIEKETTVPSNGSGTAPLLKRAFMFLEDGKWAEANEYCEKVLDQDPECAEAYLGKLMAKLKVSKRDDLKDCVDPFDREDDCVKAGRFSAALAEKLKADNDFIRERNETNRKDTIYTEAFTALNHARTEADYEAAAELFQSISGWKDADAKVTICYEEAEVCHKNEIYSKALKNMEYPLMDYYTSALSAFESIKGWKDSEEKIELCKRKIEEIKAKADADRLEVQRKAEERRIAAEKAAKKRKKAFAIGTPIVCAIIAFVIVLNTVIIPNGKYNDAIALMDAGKVGEAFHIFGELGDYKDAQEKTMKCSQSLSGLLAAGDSHTVGLRADGTVVATEYTGDYYDGQCAVDGWTDIVAIASGDSHTVGLRADGTVVATECTGYADHGQCAVDGWTDIVAIATGRYHTVGLRADGTVVATEYTGDYYDGQCAVDGWTDIVALAAGGTHTVGLRADGTVVATEYTGDPDYNRGQCAVDGWTDIVALAAGYDHTVGLRADGTVVATGDNRNGRCDVDGWTDIVAIAAGDYHTVGLRADGTVVATGSNYDGRCAVDGWTDIVALAAGWRHTVGLRADGTVVATEYTGDDDYDYGQCAVDGWKNINLPSA